MGGYEALCAAIGMIDAASEILAAHGDLYDDEKVQLNGIRNQLNVDRNAALFNIVGKTGVYSVDELPRAQKAGKQ